MTEGVKCMSGVLFLSHAMYKAVKVSRQVESYTRTVNFTLLSRHFACIQAVGEKWLSTSVC